jgi:PAS domain S-box-containing protein
MKIIGNLSIKNKIIVVVLFTTVLTLFSGISFVAYHDIQSFKQEMLGRTEMNARLMGKHCLSALIFNDEKAIAEKLSLFQTIPEVSVGQVYDKDGKLYTSYNRNNEVFTYSGVKKTNFTQYIDNYLVVSEPIIRNNEFYGTIVIKANLEYLYGKINNYILKVGSFTFFLLIIAAFIAWRIQKIISAPVLKLAEVTKKISKKPDYSVRVTKENNDEIGVLYDGFNSMLEQIQHREQQRNAALEDLEQSQERFRRMSEASFDAILVLEHSGKIIFWNQAAEKVFYYLAGEAFQLKLSSLIDQSSFSSEENFLNYQDIEKGELMLNTKELVGRRKDGTSFPIEISIVPISVKSAWHALVTIKDISRRKQTEIELLKAKEKAEQSDKLKSAFLANMSHEIRTPMNSIIGFAELLAEGTLSDDKRQRYVNFILSSGKSLLNLINDIIDISKIEAGQLKIKKLPCSINSILNELFTSYFETKSKEQKYTFDLRLSRPSQDSNEIILTDPFRFKQIFINLIGNAFKFTEKGYIEFGYKITDSKEILFYVQDTGIGIPKEKQDLVFDRFGQVDEALHKNQGGTGLGLTISKKLVELLGGKMWLESIPDEGSTFYFSLPYEKPDRQISIANQPSKRRTSLNLQTKTILIAEDEETNYMFLDEVLATTGANVLWAKNGEEAIKACQENDKIDLILMDVKMPVIDGYEAAQRIKEFRKDIVIIAQTAYAMSGEKEKSQQAQCNDYITKPISPQKLLEMIAKYL